MLGTPYYMSPEQAEGVRTLDHRTDIWALGVIAFECLVGRRPFDGETLGSLLLAICTRPMPVPSQYGAVPAGFDAWFSRACARDLNERFSSAKDAAAQLKAICEGSAALPSVPPDSLQSGPVRVLDAGVAAASSLVNSGGGFSATNVGLNAGSRRGRTIIGVAVGLLLLVGISAAGVLIWRTLSQQAQPELPHRATTQVPSVAGPPPPAAVPPVQVAAPVVSVAPLTTKSVSSEASHEKPPSALTPKVSKPAQAPSKPAQAPAKPAVQEVPKVAPTKPRVNLGI
jgi:serine/threonine-protein kinase